MITHGLSKNPIYRLWHQIKKRCYNSADISFKWYGGRGIKMCSEWENSFVSFYSWCLKNGWEKGLSIDRKDNKKDYSSENCTFVLRSINSQRRHQDSPVNHKGNLNPNAKLTLDSIKELRNDIKNNVSVAMLIKIYKISRTHIYRIKNGLRWNSIDPLIQQLD
jgi:hypothetical protein